MSRNPGQTGATAVPTGSGTRNGGGPGWRRCPGAPSGRRYRYHRILFVLSLAVLASAAPLRAPASGNGGSVHPAVWRIHNQAYTSAATAFAIGPNRFVTNAHVVGDLLALGSREVFLTQTGNPERLTVSGVLALSVTFDLAHLETRETVAHHLELAAGVSRTHSDWLTVHGYPGGTPRVLEQAARIAYEDDLSLGVAVNGEGLFALSGAPVLDPEGKAGLVVHSANANFLLGVKAQNVREFVSGRAGVACRPDLSAGDCVGKAIDHAARLAGAGNALARHELASTSLPQLRGVHGDESRLRWLREAAESGLPVAQEKLGFAYKDGSRGLEPDPEEAYKWFSKAASGNSPPSQHQVSLAYYGGRGVPRDARSAFHWARRAAENGYNPARYNLSGFHIHGVGVKANRALGRYWMRKAARHGNEPARALLRKHLGELCRPGCW